MKNLITSSPVNPHNMAQAELATYFFNRCDNWNLNAGLMDIVGELKEDGIRSDSREFKVFTQEFNKFFNAPKVPVVEAIKEILESEESL
jgi:hypothetical protein